MCRCLLIVLLAFFLSGASPLAGSSIPALVNEAKVKDTEHDEFSTVASNTGVPSGELGPEVPDMLSGVTVNQTFLHNADSDNDQPGATVAPVPELSTHHTELDHMTNLTDKVNSPRVMDPGTTHQEESRVNKSSVVLMAVNATTEDSKNITKTKQKKGADVNGAIPELPPLVATANMTAQTSSSTATNKTIKEVDKVEEADTTTVGSVQSTKVHSEEKAEGTNSTKVAVDNVTRPTTPASGDGRAAEPTSSSAVTSVQGDGKPRLPASTQVEVFPPSGAANESHSLMIGFQPQTSEQHADLQQLSASADTSFLQPSQSAAILAGVFVVVALLGYMGLLVWRRLLEKKYGNREMLVNEDEFYDTSDLRHFEL